MMQKTQRTKIAQYVKKNHRRSTWRKVVRILSGVVVFCTTYALILPAITAEKNYLCGLEPHEHVQECYIQELLPQLTCSLEEQEAHGHEEGCYEANQLLCSLLEHEPHTHGDGCYIAQQLICSQEEREAHSHEESCYEGEQLICTMEECEAHTHEEACYITNQLICTIGEREDPVHEESCYGDKLICDKAESEGHVHEETCYTEAMQDVLNCELEQHTHSEACLVDLNADLETPGIWEKTVARVELTGNWAQDLAAIATSQAGYRESEKNYLEQPDRGYTRYGAWYGIPYGRWDAMFASFCLRYAGIPQEVIGWESDSARWVESLKNSQWTSSNMGKVPGTGDLLFYRDSEAAPIRAAIVLNKEGSQIQIVEGDRDNQVLRYKVALADIILVGCCGVEQIQDSWNAHNASEVEAEIEENEPVEETEAPQQMVFEAQTDNYLVTVTCGSDMILPEGTELRVSEYSKDSETYIQRCQEAGYELEWLLNIGFFLGEEELKLDGDFVVTVVSKDGSDLGRDITHFAQEGTEYLTATDTTESVEDDKRAVSFQTGSFSDFGGGVATYAAKAAGDTLTGFQFTTADPRNLSANTDYVIYTGNGTA